MDDNKMTIDVAASTNLFQRQLRAIADHCLSLSDALSEIEQTACPNCGSALSETKSYADNEVKNVTLDCNTCGYKEMRDSKGNTLSIQFECEGDA